MEETDKKVKENIDLEKEKEEISRLLNTRAYQVEKIRKELSEPKGFLQKKCPKCGEKLWGGRLNSYYKYFICIHCFYDYSKLIKFSLPNLLKNFIHPVYSKEFLDFLFKEERVVNIKEICHRLTEIKRKEKSSI